MQKLVDESKDSSPPSPAEAGSVIDAHCHLEEIDNLDLVIEKAKSVGVIAIIAVGSDYQSNRKVFWNIAPKYHGFVFPAFGYHPARLKLSEITDNLKFIENYIIYAVGIGEIGLDYKKDIKKAVSVDLQKSVLRNLLTIAKRHRKPVIIHSRYAWQDTFDLVKESGVEKAVFHWYSGTSSVRRKIIEEDYFLSANPAAEHSREHREAIKDAPLDRLLLETDSPVRNWELADVLRSLKAVAELKNLSQEEIAQVTTDNAMKFFNLPLTL